MKRQQIKGSKKAGFCLVWWAVSVGACCQESGARVGLGGVSAGQWHQEVMWAPVDEAHCLGTSDLAPAYWDVSWGFFWSPFCTWWTRFGFCECLGRLWRARQDWSMCGSSIRSCRARGSRWEWCCCKTNYLPVINVSIQMVGSGSWQEIIENPNVQLCLTSSVCFSWSPESCVVMC